MENLCRTESRPHTPTIELVKTPRQESLESSDHFVTLHPQSGKT